MSGFTDCFRVFCQRYHLRPGRLLVLLIKLDACAVSFHKLLCNLDIITSDDAGRSGSSLQALIRRLIRCKLCLGFKTLGPDASNARLSFDLLRERPSCLRGAFTTLSGKLRSTHSDE